MVDQPLGGGVKQLWLGHAAVRWADGTWDNNGGRDYRVGRYPLHFGLRLQFFYTFRSYFSLANFFH